MMRHRHGFSLIELLVVVTIIAILAGLVIALIAPVKFNAKKMITGQRMQVVTQGLAQRGQDEGSASYAIQVALGLEGIYRFDTNATTPTAAAGAVGPSLVVEASPSMPPPDQLDYMFNYPWGKKWPNNTGPSAHLLRNLNPIKTMEFLRLAGVMTEEQYTDTNGNGVHDSGEPYTDGNGNGTYDDYRWFYKTDRSEKQAWNDKWGHPLVVAYGIFQPKSGNDPVANVPYQTQALQVYQYARSIYVSVAAAGTYVRNIDDTKLKSTTESDWVTPVTSWNNTSFSSASGGNLGLIWKQANQICQQDKSTLDDTSWNETAFDNPPWQDVKWGKKKVNGRDENCFLTAPLEIK
jgi:prepilin-type N-terminal cleavage/methylation domain-containing protein